MHNPSETNRPDAGSGRPRIVVLTGPSRAGKTTVCRKVVDGARGLGLSVAGVLTEDGTTASGIQLQIARDLRTSERRLLATVREERPPDSAELSPRTPLRGAGSHLRWAFDASGVAFGHAALTGAMTGGCDLLVVDQIGPLEMRRGRGWTIALDVLERARYGLALVVVNPRVLDEVSLRLPGSETIVVDTATRDALPGTILAACPSSAQPL